MGSNETATATTGGPRVIDIFDANEAPSGPNCTLFRGQNGSWRSLEVGLVVGKRLHRLRHRCGGLELPGGSGTHCQAIHGQMSRSAERIGRLCPEPGRMRRRRLHTSYNDPRRPPGDLGTANRQASAGAANARRGRQKPKIFLEREFLIPDFHTFA